MIFALCSNNFEDLSFATGVAESCGGSLVFEAKIASIFERCPDPASIEALFVSVDSESDLTDRLKELKSFDVGRVHFIFSGESSVGRQLFSNGIPANLIFKRFEDPAAEGRHYARVIRSRSASTFPSLRNLFPAASIHTLDLEDWIEKENVTDLILHQLIGIGCSERVSQTVSSAVDELLLNAFSSGLKRTTTGDTNDSAYGPSIQIQLGTEGEYVGVSVTSFSNSMDAKKILLDLGAAFDKVNAQGDTPKSSFGLGLALILRTGASLRFFCSSGRFAEVSIVFKKTQRLIDFRKQFQFVATQLVGSF